MVCPAAYLALSDVTISPSVTNSTIRSRVSVSNPPGLDRNQTRSISQRVGRLQFKVFSDYSHATGAGFLIGGAPEQAALAVARDETEWPLTPAGADAPAVQLDGEARGSNATAGDACSLSMDDNVHPHERDLRVLMTASLDGDAEAYHALLKRITAHLRAYYRNRLAQIGHGPTEAEDLLQEALLAIHTRRNTYDRRQPFTPWLFAIARYKFLDFLRRTKSSFRDLPLESAGQIVADSDVDAIESSVDLLRLMLKISEKASKVIQYVKVEGMTVSEAAKRCKLSESAVKVTIHRGLKALAVQIRKENA